MHITERMGHLDACVTSMSRGLYCASTGTGPVSNNTLKNMSTYLPVVESCGEPNT